MQKFNRSIYNIVLILFITANILDLFITRGDIVNYYLRLPIQLINGFVFALMSFQLITTKHHRNKVISAVWVFVVYIIAHVLIYLITTSSFAIESFAQYLKLLVWLIAIIFFYEQFIRFGINFKLIKIYIYTFTIASLKKILETSSVLFESLGGGDTASLALLLLIPLIFLIFEGNYKLYLLGFVTILILFSLRRTAIIGLFLATPFIYKEIKSSIKKFHIIIFATLFITVIFYSWNFIEDAIVYRFTSLFEQSKESDYGSGRSVFYLVVWNGWWDGELLNIVFGNGLGSVAEILSREYAAISHAHNDFLEIGYTFGLGGTVIYLSFLSKLHKTRKVLKHLSSRYVNILNLTIITYLVVALASGTILRISTLTFALTISILVAHAQKGKDAKSKI